MNKDSKPLISVIIPCYNPRLDLFKQAIESVLAQSYKNWEVIIVDDGSNSIHKEKIGEYIGSINDKRISTIYLKENCGVSTAKNKGIEIAKGEIVTFLDADDIYLPWYCEEIINRFLKNFECNIVATPELYYFSFWYKKYLVLPDFYIQFLEQSIKLNNQNKKIILAFPPRIAIKKNLCNFIRFDPGLRTSEDLDFCLQILNSKDLLRNTQINFNLGYLYRIHQSRNRLTQKMNNLLEGNKSILRKYTDRESSVYEILERWKNYGLWKYASNILNKKANNVRNSLTTIIKYKVLPEIFYVDYMHLKEIFMNKNKGDELTGTCEKFKTYIENCQADSRKEYALRTFNSIY